MKFFKRSIKLQIISYSGDVKIFESKKFTIEFDAEFGGKSPSTVKITNVLDSTADMCRHEIINGKPGRYASMELYAGYNEEYSKLISAQIVSHELKRSGTERILEIKAGAFASSLNQIIMETYEFVPASEIFKDLFRKTDIPNYELRLSEDLTLDRISLTGTLEKAIADLCAKTKSVMITKYGKIIIEGKVKKPNFDIVLLSRESGLIGSPLRNGNRMKVKSLLNPMLTAGEVFELHYSEIGSSGKKTDSKSSQSSVQQVSSGGIFREQYKILNGKHYGSNRNDSFFTEFECEKI